MNKRTSQGKPAGHTRKCNYDDINEFFWSPECLQYSYHASDEPGAGQAAALSRAMLLEFGSGLDMASVSELPMVKRYVERRSWLAPIRSFWRIHAFLLQMLYVSLCIAFCERRNGVVVDGTLLQSLSGILLAHASVSIIQEILAVYLLYGMLHTHLAEFVSLILRLAWKVSLLVGLSYTYYEMILQAPFAAQHVPPMVWIKDVLFHHRLFCYVSLVYMTPAVLSALCQVFPCLSTRMRLFKGPLKLVCDVFDPLNRLYVGKDVHASCTSKVHFDFFWLSLLTWKFTFSMIFQIQPLVEPTHHIWNGDFSGWYPDVELGKLPNLVVLFVRWGPLILMYMLDVQIWYMLWVAFYGTLFGWKLRIGEVPDFNKLRERLVEASEHFNRKLLSSEVPLICETEPPYSVPTAQKAPPNGTSTLTTMQKLHESLLGEAGPEVRNESMRYFSAAWNKIVHDLRMSDMLSDQEHKMMRFNNWEGVGFSRCTYMPVFCTAGMLNEAIHLASKLSLQGSRQMPHKRLGLEQQLFVTISSSSYMREAVVEFWELSLWMLRSLLGQRHQAALRTISAFLIKHQQSLTIMDVLNPSNLPKLLGAMVDLAKALLDVKLVPVEGAPEQAVRVSAEPNVVGIKSVTHVPSMAKKQIAADTNVSRVMDKLRGSLDALKMILSSSAQQMAAEIESLKFTSSGFFWDDAYAREQLQTLLLAPQASDQLRGLVLLCSTARLDAQPSHLEVNRRLSWFVGSLFMEIPKPPPVTWMKSWGTMTPFCAEDILYAAKELAAKNEDGVSVLYFLKSVHPEEWQNFLQRIKVSNKPSDEAKLFQDRELLQELRLWASYRGQTLARTVEGMMQHEHALRLLAEWEGKRGEELETLLRLKFGYVVSCQLYGQHKRMRDPKAADTEFLLQRYPNLRVAYVDKTTVVDTTIQTDGTSVLREQVRYYSVLIKGTRQGSEELVQQVYHVQLPGDIMLGEGKPENQNHAMIFSRGEAVQAIDMNQCGYFEEALKMRNLLQEFDRHPGSTILGFREHIFTGEQSSLASYMALQEGCFVTLTQRVLWDPLCIRLHYGHPDVFDKLFSITNGGISKASRGINLSEDIYAGFNHLLRGGTIPYIEYVQVGKGRDVGMQQIYKFEAKLASGNAEQCLSRDVYRIGSRLDFTRGFSFYYSGPGFYFNNAATVFAMFFFLYLQLFSHILQLDTSVAIADLLNAQWTLQLGLLLSIPILCFLAVEYGLIAAIKKFINILTTGSLFFFMFHMGTKAYYFDSTLKFGGAKYRPTGRGFVMRHEEFAELYRFYAASHLYNGFELLWGLVLLNTLGSWPMGISGYWRTTWSLWAVMVSWLFSPFWFNPLAFDMTKNRADVLNWWNWMKRKDAAALSSWESWWIEEHSYVYTGSWVKKMFILLPAIRYALTFVGILGVLSKQSMHTGLMPELLYFCKVLGGVGACALLLFVLPRILHDRPMLQRVTSTAVLVLLLINAPTVMMPYLSLFNAFHFAIATGYLLAALTRIPFAFGVTPYLCIHICKVYDYICGGLLMALCLLLSATECMKHVQARALLSDAFNQGVQYNRLSRLLIPPS
mmetsp:Transcript_21477/g.35435  ORF Transcript_21477/g.35435 Transcript_21477/m.35435 type:complete len:1570 (+) Transcript_21477:3-4712(+)